MDNGTTVCSKRLWKSWPKVIEQTQDLTLVTDGERRYGNLLFEICRQALRTGQVGRPQMTLPKGVKVRLKNKGDQNRHQGRKRPKYEAPQAEHPDTSQDLAEADILPIIWKGSTPASDASWPVTAAKPTPMPRPMSAYKLVWMSSGSYTTSCGLILPPSKYRPSRWASWTKVYLCLNFLKYV